MAEEIADRSFRFRNVNIQGGLGSAGEEMFIWKILCVWKVFALGIYRYKKTVIPTGITVLRAIDGVRTRDPDLGKVVLYQLSHYRVLFAFLTWNNTYYTIRSYRSQHFFKNNVSEF